MIRPRFPSPCPSLLPVPTRSFAHLQPHDLCSSVSSCPSCAFLERLPSASPVSFDTFPPKTDPSPVAAPASDPQFTLPPNPVMPMQPEDLLQHILVANATYAEAFSQSDPVLLAKLAKGQSPRICWLGCSDSRVSAELSTGVAPGSIFVHRNIAQCFHPGDQSALAALSFAVHQLKVEAIIVCGHTGCGGVKAAMMAAQDEVQHGSPLPGKTAADRIISDWIAPIKNLALDQIAAHAHPEETNGHSHTSYDPLSAQSLATLTDQHVAETVKAVSESQIVRDAWDAGMELSVHGWVYHVATAKLRDLNIGVRGVGTPAFSLGSRPSSYAGSKATTGSDSEEPDSEGEEGSFASSLDEKLEAKLSI